LREWDLFFIFVPTLKPIENMSVTLNINGSLGLTFLNEEKQVVDAEQQKDLETKLQSGEYVISLASREVHSLPDFKRVAYFDIEVYDDTEYDFEIE
jgi:hypothetical protein